MNNEVEVLENVILEIVNEQGVINSGRLREKLVHRLLLNYDAAMAELVITGKIEHRGLSIARKRAY